MPAAPPHRFPSLAAGPGPHSEGNLRRRPWLKPRHRSDPMTVVPRLLGSGRVGLRVGRPIRRRREPGSRRGRRDREHRHPWREWRGTRRIEARGWTSPRAGWRPFDSCQSIQRAWRPGTLLRAVPCRPMVALLRPRRSSPEGMAMWSLGLQGSEHRRLRPMRMDGRSLFFPDRTPHLEALQCPSIRRRCVPAVRTGSGRPRSRDRRISTSESRRYSSVEQGHLSIGPTRADRSWPGQVVDPGGIDRPSRRPRQPRSFAPALIRTEPRRVTLRGSSALQIARISHRPLPFSTRRG